jgi:hypothetical protein
MPFPDVAEIDFSKDIEKTREALDYAEMQYSSRGSQREHFQKLYNAYNGIIDQAEIDSVIKSTGRRSKTKYVKYRLGRSKLKQLHGEFLEINLTPTIFSVNPEAKNEKMKKYKKILGMSLGKPYIETLRELGFDVFSGYNIPDQNQPDFWTVDKFKLANEIVMQDIIIDKVKNGKLKSVLYQNLIDLTITAEMHGKIEKDRNGVDSYRFIPSSLALYEEEVFDPLLTRSPYHGEVRKLYSHEILSNPEFKLDPEQKQALKAMATEYTDSLIGEGNQNRKGTYPAIPVYTIQWKGLEAVRIKTVPAKDSNVPYKHILSEKYYQENKSQIDYDVKKGKYTLEEYYQEIVWTASKIGRDIYTKAEKNEDIIQRLRENGKLIADFDYVGLLFSTVDGVRVSIQEIIYELERIYDDLRFQINKEIRKIRGSALVYDKAFLPKGKLLSDVIHDISEEGIVVYDSSAEGNRSSMEAESNKVGISSIDLGENQSLIVLLNQALDIERVMDRITGMNENRQGLSKATSTATANINNIEASRSMTYDIFFFMNMFIEEMLLKLAEKTKLNKTLFGQDQRHFLYDQDQIAYMMATKDIDKDNYGVSVTDGRRERDILQKLEMMFPQEVNAGGITSRDVAKFMMESNFTRALKILDQARERMEQFRLKEAEAKQSAEMQGNDMRIQMAREDREDKQVHDRDMEVLRTEGKKEVEFIKGGIKGRQETQKQAADMATANTGRENDI